MLRNALFRLFRANEVKVHELNYLFWECTTRCNLHCRHCGSDCLAASQDVDMPLEDFLRALDTIPVKERPPEFTVVLTGGEPLLRPDIAEVGRAIRQRGVGWSMVSNGWFYDEAMHRRLMAAGMGALTISLDGLGEDHDWMRGRAGSYERTLRAIAIAAKEFRINFDVVSCINRRSIGQLYALYEKLVSMGVQQWRIFTIIPIGRAKDDSEMHLTDEEFTRLMDFIQVKREAAAAMKEGPRPMNVTFSCEGYLGRYERKVRQNPFFCRAGVNIASVLIDGRICGCPNIDRDVFSQGNIYQDSLWDVWQNRFVPFRNHDWARKGRCADCPVWRDCLGNGMHNWHGDCREVINCHYQKVRNL